MVKRPDSKALVERLFQEGKCKCKARRPLEIKIVKGIEVKLSRCIECKEAQQKREAKPEIKALRKAARQSDHGKALQRKANQSDAGKARKKRFKASAKGTEQMKRTNRSAAFKASKKKYNEKLKKDQNRWVFEVLQTKVRKMAKGLVSSSSRVLATIGVDSQTLREHLESTWPDDGSMNWNNYGYGKGKWNIGHRIAKAMYDASHEEDVKRCWSLCNLFAQDHMQNRKLGVKLPAYPELLSLQHVWPSAWNDSLPTPSQIAVYESNAQFNKTDPIPSGRMSPSSALFP